LVVGVVVAIVVGIAAPAAVVLGAAGAAVVSILGGSAACSTGGAVAVATSAPASSGAFSSAQVANAALIVQTATNRGLGGQGALVGLVTAIQETGLRNLANGGLYLRPADSRVLSAAVWGQVQPLLSASAQMPNDGVTPGDWDSVGLFAQRPTAGYGGTGPLAQKIATLMQPADAAAEFFDRLAQIPGWDSMAAGDAAQAVQRSAYPDRYAAHINDANQLLQAVSGIQVSPTGDGSCLNATVAASGGSGSGALAWAQGQLGRPYLWGAAGPDAFDCSGLTQQAWAAVGVALPHDSRRQYAQTQRVAFSDLQPGDLVFWATDTADPTTIYHVAMWMGNNQILEAPAAGLTVRVAPMRWLGTMPFGGRP